MKSIYRIFAVVALLALAACSPTKIFIPVDKPILVKPGANMVVDCEISKPPKASTYIVSTASDKEKQLYEYSSSLLNDLATCNTRWSTLRQWYVDQKKVVEKEDNK